MHFICRDKDVYIDFVKGNKANCVHVVLKWYRNTYI